MSLPHFLVDALPTGDAFVLDGPEGHHASAVQRMRVGERLVLVDGRGGMARAAVTAAGRNTLTLRLESRRYEQPSDPRLVVVQAIAKGERGELAVQAMTEAGVDEIVPWSAARSVVRWREERGARSRERWVATAREAAKQARRSWLPVIGAAASTAQAARRLAASGAAFVLHEAATSPLSAVDLPRSGDIALVVGPEGGITDDELATLAAAGARPVRLGPTVLRASTAGVAAIAVLAARLGRW